MLLRSYVGRLILDSFALELLTFIVAAKNASVSMYLGSFLWVFLTNIFSNFLASFVEHDEIFTRMVVSYSTVPISH